MWEIGRRILHLLKYHSNKVVRLGLQWSSVATHILIRKLTFLAKLLANTDDIISSRIFTSLAIVDVYNVGIVQQCQMLESELNTDVLVLCLKNPEDAPATVKSTKTDIIKVWLWALAVICCHPPLSQICSHSGWNCILVHGSRSWCAGDTWNAISAKRTQSSSLWKLFLSILWYISEQRLMHCGSIAFAQTSWCGEQSVMWRNHFRSKGCRFWHHFLRCKLKTKHYFSWHLSIITLFPLHNIFYYIIPCTLFTTSLCMPMPYGSCNIRTLNFELSMDFELMQLLVRWTMQGLAVGAVL